MSHADVQPREGGSARLTRWLRRGLMAAGGTGVAVLASAGFATSAAADDGEGLLGGVTSTVAQTVDDAAAPVVRELASPVVEEGVTAAVRPVVRVAEPVAQGATGAVADNVVAPVVKEVVEPVVREVAQPVADVTEQVVQGVAPVVRPVLEDVVEPVTEGVGAPVVDGVLAPVTGTSVVPIIAPVVGSTNEAPPGGTESSSSSAPDLAEATQRDTPAAAVERAQPREAAALRGSVGPAFDVHLLVGTAIPPTAHGSSTVIGSGAPHAPDGAPSGPLPAALPGPPTSAASPGNHSAGAMDADVARGFIAPGNDLSFSIAAASPSASLDVLLEVAVAPD